MAGTLTLRVITPDRIALDRSVASVRLPALDGSIGVLPRHAPMMSQSERHVFVHSQGIEQRRILEHETNPQPHLVQLRFAHRHEILVVDHDTARRRLDQPCESLGDEELGGI